MDNNTEQFDKKKCKKTNTVKKFVLMFYVEQSNTSHVNDWPSQF